VGEWGLWPCAGVRETGAGRGGFAEGDGFTGLNGDRQGVKRWADDDSARVPVGGVWASE